MSDEWPDLLHENVRSSMVAGGRAAYRVRGRERPIRAQAGGQTFRCTLPRGLLAPGDHVLQVELDLANQTRLRNAVRWTVLANTEP